MISGSASNKNTSSGTRKMINHLASRPAAIRVLRAHTIALSALRMHLAVRSLKNILTTASRLVLMSKALTPKWQPVSGNSKFLPKGAKAAGDQVWVARYLLERTAEKYGVAINWHCKPLGATDWNGSGMHANFSNSLLRTCGSKKFTIQYASLLHPYIKEHIAVYGADNHLRLTGKHETQSIDKFSYGVSDRGASIRIPIATVENNWKGWLEDRRPNSSADPYKVAARIIKTVKTVPEYATVNGH